MSLSGIYRVGDVIELELDENTSHASSKRDNCSARSASATDRDQNQPADIVYQPTPLEIECMAAQIRAEWSEREYRNRAAGEPLEPTWEVPVVTVTSSQH